MRAQDYTYFAEDLNKFCSRYRAQAKSGQTTRRADPVWSDSSYSSYRDLYMNTYEVPTVVLTMSEPDLIALMNELNEVNTPEYKEFVGCRKILGHGFINELQSYKYRQSREEQIRNQNPGVKKAWENYQLMLKLAGNNTQ